MFTNIVTGGRPAIGPRSWPLLLVLYILYSLNLVSVSGPCAANDAPGNCCDIGQAGDGQCGEGEGDCDNDDGCAPGLLCGTDNCPAGMPSTHDCCYKPSKIIKLAFLSTLGLIGLSKPRGGGRHNS